MIYPLLYIPFCIAFAWLNAILIKKGKRIYHALNGMLHLSVAIVIGYFTHWQYGLATLCITRLFFDVSLNLFRGLPIDYVSPKPKSIVDIAEKKIFGNDGFTPKVIYLVAAVALFIWVQL